MNKFQSPSWVQQEGAEGHSSFQLPYLLSKVPLLAFDKAILDQPNDIESNVNGQSSKTKQSNSFTSPLDILILITDHKHIDYDMVSDFLLTYRMFMSSNDLLEGLLARFAWACSDHSQSMTVSQERKNIFRSIALRTFVVLRHWILNFFPDDFVPNFALRAKFVTTLNLMYTWSAVESDEHYRHMLHQLKQAWMGLCCMYWQLGAFEKDSFDLSLPIFPGGQFGDSTIESNVKSKMSKETKAERRRSLLSFYDGPIKPVLNGDDIPCPCPGTYIKGGIALFCDVQVDKINPPTPVKKIVLSEKIEDDRTPTSHKHLMRPFTHKTKSSSNKHSDTKQSDKANSLWSNTKSIGLFSKLAKILDCVVKPAKPGLELDESQMGPIKIDMLCARVIEELNLFLESYAKEDESAASRPQATAQDVTPNTMSMSMSGSPVRRSHAHQLNVSRRRARQTPQWLESDGRSSVSKTSYISYDEDFSSSGGDSINQDTSQYMGSNSRLKRLARVSNLRKAAAFHGDIPSESWNQSVSSSSNSFNRYQDPASDSEGRPSYIAIAYSGIDTDVANELAAISDDEIIGGDAVNTALLKLEGTFVRPNREAPTVKVISEFEPVGTSSSQPLPQSTSQSSLGLTVQYSSMHNSNLFKAAFESKMDIAALRNTSSRQISEYRDLSLPSNQVLRNAKDTPLEAIVSQRIVSDTAVWLPASNTRVAHASFILRYSSRELCEQLTLIEKDALAEIDWKELIELAWNKEIRAHSSWLQVLADGTVHGIELVIARFNLVVNWIKSEIVLTTGMEERVQTIARFIHVALHARNMQNYATAMQIVLALSSSLIMSLKSTWAEVSNNDKEILQQLTDLMSPLKNFTKLRSSLENLDTDNGCIPFVGLYLSDLTFNNERFATNEGLINFHKYQVNASVTKSLLQCIEWSNYYKILANNELMAKCLYIQSLTQDEMEHFAASLNSIGEQKLP